ncbi:phosphatidic acid phosphatase type 2/haloperoxidase [Obelidium mucronatum]|nr:phosphatidic acid phosphatase type 2/haloperoxidase [Obelidium mucronatum]
MRQLVAAEVERQSASIAVLQQRTPVFVRTLAEHLGLLGTHEFFLGVLPLLFFGDDSHADDSRCFDDSLGLSLVAVLSLGVVLAAALKDAVCAPRPLLAAGVRRRTDTATAAEFGLPSTHSANAMSVAVVVVCLSSAWSPWSPYSSLVLVAIYPLAMGVSRVLSGMHSWLDVVAGWTLGALVAAAWLALLPLALRFLATSTLAAVMQATLVVPLFLALHPDPIGPCPCFEDAVAFVSVLAGVLVGFHLRLGARQSTDSHLENPASFIHSSSDSIYPYYYSLMSSMIPRILVGAVLIFVFRKVTKAILTPLFNLLFPSCSDAAIIAKKKKAEAERLNHESKKGKSAAKQQQQPPPPKYKIYRLTNKIFVNVVVYFGIAVLAVHTCPQVFKVIGI